MARKQTNAPGSSRAKKPDVLDLLEQAAAAPSKKERMEYLEQADALAPDNPVAQLSLAQAKMDMCGVLRAQSLLIDLEGRRLKEEEGITEKDVGSYWGLYETRDYMRLRFERMEMLETMGRFRAAAAEGEEMIRLCENDNLGVRYRLLGYYLYLEEFDQLKTLLAAMEEKGEDSLEMALARSLMYWTLGEEESALEQLKKVTVPGFRVFIKAMLDNKVEEKYLEDRLDMDEIGGYSPNTVQHLLELTDIWEYLISTHFVYLQWAYEKYKRPVRRKS